MATRKKKVTSSPSGRYLRKFTLQNVRTFRSPVTLDFCHSDGSVAQWTVILGENGTGKTTLLQYLAGMMPTKMFSSDSNKEGTQPSFGPMLADPDWQAWHATNLPSWPATGAIEAHLLISELSENRDSSRSAAPNDENIRLSYSFARQDGGQTKVVELGSWRKHNSEYPAQFRIFGYGAGRHIASGASPI